MRISRRQSGFSRRDYRQLKPLEGRWTRLLALKDLSLSSDLTVQLAVDDLRRLQFTHGKLEARAKRGEVAVNLQYHGRKTVRSLKSSAS